MARMGPERPRPLGNQHETCLEGTRESILREIRLWAKDKQAEKRIFWLCDIGGSGKSTVAYTLSQEWYTSEDVLLGRFFFSKNARDTTDTDIFCSTIAKDLASKHPRMNIEITEAFKSDTLLSERNFGEQFRSLIMKPLQSVTQNIVLVIDAVDECKPASRKGMIQTLLKQLISLPNVKVLLTSRPEPDLMSLLQGEAIVRGMHFEMQGAKNQSNMKDISVYIDHHLTEILSHKHRQRLVGRSNGLFIWVSTARTELELAADNPAQFKLTLELLLDSPGGGDLDALYLGILNRVLRGEFKDIISQALSILVGLYEPVSIAALGALMNANEEDLELIVKSMRSVLHAGKTIEFMHPTFREYLLASQSNGTIPAPNVLYVELALRTVEVLQADLKRNICNIDTSGPTFIKNSDIPDLEDRLSALLRRSPALFYCSRQWANHICQTLENGIVFQSLSTFLRTKLLNLIELLSLTHQLLFIQGLVDLQKRLEVLWPGSAEIEVSYHTTTERRSSGIRSLSPF
jgi:hypothetical protein